MKHFLLYFYILINIAGFACRTDMTAPVSPDVQLSAEEVAVTEAWLRVHVAQVIPHDSIRIARNDATVLTLGFTSADTLLIDERLLPKQTYTYKLYSYGTSKPNFSSEMLTITTMDTTSHDFTWQIDTLGDGNASILFDVAIINDTLAYAVGEMYLKDSTGQFDPTAYNLAKWNGTKWQLLRMQFLDFCNQTSTYSYPAKAMFAFSATDIWIASGSQIVRWNGITQMTPQCIPVSVNKLWGESDNSMYVVGANGGLAFLNGSTWQKLESGTTVDINDIFGKTLLNNDIQILAAASNRYTLGERKLLQITQGGNVNSLAWSPQQRLNTVWFASRHAIYVGGGGLFVGEPGRWKQILDLPNYYSTRIRGTERNNVLVTGAFGLCGHFNGMTWQTYPELQLPDGTYEGLAVSARIVVAVGQVGNRAVVVRGYR